MKTLLFRPITGARFDRWFSWVAGFGLLTACTTLVLRRLPEMELGWSAVLVGGVGLAWIVLGHCFPCLSRKYYPSRNDQHMGQLS